MSDTEVIINAINGLGTSVNKQINALRTDVFSAIEKDRDACRDRHTAIDKDMTKLEVHVGLQRDEDKAIKDRMNGFEKEQKSVAVTIWKTEAVQNILKRLIIAAVVAGINLVFYFLRSGGNT